MKTWKLEDAKNGFSEVVRRALAHQPQRVTRGGRDAVVVISADDYARLTASTDLVEFLQRSPLAEALRDGELDLERPRESDRDLDLP
jgi:prevent-host-death family protein